MHFAGQDRRVLVPKGDRTHDGGIHGDRTHDDGSYGNEAPSRGAARRTMDHTTEDAAVAWLRTIKWDWFATCTFGPSAHGGTPAMAERAAHEWMAHVRAEHPKAYAIVAIEEGAHLGGWHVHALIGGVGAHPEWSRRLERAWRANGPVQVTRYDPARDPKAHSRRGVVPYLRKQVGDELTIIGTMKRWRPRRAKE